MSEKPRAPLTIEDGEIAIRDGHTHCDFCGQVEPQWSYPCENFLMHRLPHGEHWSRGEWLCCDSCKPFVDARDWSGLLEHRATSGPYATITGEMAVSEQLLVTAELRRMWGIFDKRRTTAMAELVRS